MSDPIGPVASSAGPSGRPGGTTVPTLLESLGERVSWVALWAIVVLVFSQAFFRYVLNVGLSWPDEMARYFHIVIVFLGLGYVTRERRHIRIDLLSRRFAGPAEEIFQLFVLFFSAAVLGVGAAQIMLRIGDLRTPAAGMPIFLFFLPPLLGSVMILFDSVRKLLGGQEAGEPGAGIGDRDGVRAQRASDRLVGRGEDSTARDGEGEGGGADDGGRDGG